LAWRGIENYRSLRYSHKSGDNVRLFKLKAFARFQRRERITDAALTQAVKDAGDGLIDADLGGGLIKQRVARRGQGKSGGYRTLIAFRLGDRAVFLFGFAKSDMDNIGRDQIEFLRQRGRAFLDLGLEELQLLVGDGDLMEVRDGDGEEGV
jgi:hypothetical protein